MKKKQLHDSIFSALRLLSKHFNLSFSKDTILSGLPLKQGHLTLELFIRASEKMGLQAKQFKKKLANIYNPTLPVVLIQNNNLVTVLLSIDRKNSSATIFSNKKESKIKLVDLEKKYSGSLFMVTPIPTFDARVEEITESQSAEGHWFWSTLWQSKKIYRDVLLGSLLVNVFAVALPLYIMNVYDRVVPNNAQETLFALSSGIIIVFFFDALIKYFRAYFVDIAGKKSDILISHSLYERLMNMKLAAFPRSVGSFASQLKDFESIREFIASATIVTLIDIPFVFLFLFVIYLISGPLLVVVLIVIFIILFQSFIVQKYMLGFIEKASKASAMKNANLIESLYGIEQIKSSNAQGFFQKKWETMTGYLSEMSISSKTLTTKSNIVTQFLQQLTTVIVVIMGVSLVNDKSLSLGGLIATIMLLSRAIAPIAQLGQLITRYQGAKIAYSALDKVMQSPVEIEPEKGYLSPQKVLGNLELSGVNFIYPNQKQPSLTNITLKIKAGEKVGIIGKVGSGKSTLFKILMNYYQPATGLIKLDGLELNQIHPNHLRDNIAYVDQNPYLFFGTIRENITQGKNHITDDDIIDAAKLTDLLNYISDHPDGLDLQVGEGGKYLSTGQRQCVAIAGGLLQSKPIILLDEPTSFLDKKNEDLFKSHLKKIASKQTLIITTQRFSMLDNVDRIIVLDKGKIVADANKSEILSKFSNHG